MLTDCSTLVECEKVLAEAVGKVRFVGQVALSQAEVDRLGGLIKERLAVGVLEGTRYIARETPASLACFLVGHGVYYYREGDYWSSLLKTIDVFDVQWQVRVGRYFLNYLKRLNMPVLHIPEAHRYVANILLHGGVPQSCLPEFFEQVVHPSVLDDLIDPDELRAVLADWRAQDRRFRELDDAVKVLKNKRDSGRKELARAARLKQIREEIYLLQEQAAQSGLPSDIPEQDYEGLQEKWLLDLAEVARKQEDLARQEKEHQQQVDDYCRRYVHIAEAAEAVQRSIREYRRVKEDWQSMAELVAECETGRSRLFAQLEVIGWQASPGGSEDLPAVAELQWDELFAALREGSELQNRLHDKEAELLKSEVRPAKPGKLFWSGTLFAAGGVITVAANPSQAALWLLPVLGLSMALLGWRRFRADWREASRRQGEVARAAQDTAQLRQQIDEKRKLVRQLAGGLCNPDYLFWDKPFPEMATALQEIYTAFTVYKNSGNRLETARKRVDTWKKGFAESAAALESGDLDDGTVEETLARVRGDIAEALAKKQKADEAVEKLNVIARELTVLQAERLRMQGVVDRAREAVAALGQGDPCRGAGLLKQRRAHRRRLGEMEQELHGGGEHYYSPDLLCRSLDDLRDLVRRLEESDREAGQEVMRREKKRESLPRPLPYLDKPIRRFLLYGDDWAEGWLIAAVRAAVLVLSGKGIAMGEEPALPPRVAEALHDWWAMRQHGPVATGVAEAPGRQRLSAPELKLEPTGVLHLDFPRQRFPLAGDAREAWVEIGQEGGAVRGERVPLRVYRQGSVLGETGPVKFPVLRLPAALVVTLGFGETILQTWRIEPFSTGLPALIFDENGSLVHREPLPRAKLWFLLPEGCCLRPRVGPLEEGVAHLEESCSMQLIDLGAVAEDGLCLVDRQGVSHHLPLSRELTTVPRLGGKKIAGVEIDEGGSLYRKADLAIHFPATAMDELEAWTVHSRPRAGYAGEEKQWALSGLFGSLKNLHDGSLVKLPLEEASVIGAEPCGRYTITVINPHCQRYRFEVNFISLFDVVFLPPLCLPAEGEAGSVELRLRYPEGVTFSMQVPSEIKEASGSASRIVVNREAGHVRGALTWSPPGGRPVVLPVALEVPGLRWRLHGLKEGRFGLWSDRVEEIWFGDWREAETLQLYLAMPHHFTGSARLSLDGTGQSYETEVKNGLARFNMLPFADTLGAVPGLGSFTLTVRDHRLRSSVGEGVLLRVRTRWEVRNLALNQETSGGMLHLSLAWRDYGPMPNRVLRWWKRDRPWAAPVLETAVPDGAGAVQLTVASAELPPGQYLLEFTVDDPWTASRVEPVFPRADRNVFEAAICGARAGIGDWDARWLGSDRVEVQGRLTGEGAGLPVEAVIYGRKEGSWFSWSGRAAAARDGTFHVTIKADKNAAHWIAITAATDPPAYIYAVLPEPAFLKFYLDENPEMAVKAGGSDIATIILTEAKDFRHDIPLNSSSKNNVLKAVQERRQEVEFPIELADGTIQKAKLEMDVANKHFTFKLQRRGVICTGCNILLPDTAAWYKHTGRSASPHCKSLIPNFEETSARMVVVWDTLPRLQKLKSASPFFKVLSLFNNFDTPLDNVFADQTDSIINLAEQLIAREKEWIGLLQQAGWLE